MWPLETGWVVLRPHMQCIVGVVQDFVSLEPQSNSIDWKNFIDYKSHKIASVLF